MSTCKFSTCSVPGQFKCGQCGTVWCSLDHQKQDWNSGHARTCAMSLINGGIEEVQKLFNMHQQTNISPDWLIKNFALTYIAAGRYGIVMVAQSPRYPDHPFALKMTVDERAEIAREAHISVLLSTLYVDNGRPLDVRTPVIKTYDYAITEWSSVAVQTLLKEAIDDRNVPVPPDMTKDPGPHTVGLILMELSSGETLESLLVGYASMEQTAWESMVVEVIVQVLLALNDLQHAVEFIHMDLHAQNVLVHVTDDPQIYHYTASSDTVFNVRTRFAAQLVDFGFSRLKYNNTVLHMPYQAYTVTEGTLDAFRPWVDIHQLALSVLDLMGPVRYKRLRSGSPLLNVLKSMLGMLGTSEDPQVGKDQRQLYRLLSETGIRRAESGPTGGSYNDIKPLAKKLRRYIAGQAGATTITTPETVLKECSPEFARFTDYHPTATDHVVDMTLQIGDQSVATKTAWKGLTAASGMFNWMTSLVSKKI